MRGKEEKESFGVGIHVLGRSGGKPEEEAPTNENI